MALSNWDTLAIDTDGNPSTGEFVKEEVVVAIYKNWLYLRDTTAWTPTCGFCEHTVAQVNEGDVEYKSLRILAKRGPQNGVFAIVQAGFGKDLAVMVGCGVDGYSHPPWPCGHQDTATMLCGPDHEDWVCGECASPIPKSEWVGVGEESRSFLAAMIVEEFSADEAAPLLQGLKSGVRFNQGDAYFARELGAKIPATPLGEAESTILQQVVDNMEKE